MNVKRHLVETLTLVIAAILLAFVSNLVASRERGLATVGQYPNARVVPDRTAATSPQNTASSVGNEIPEGTTREQVLERFPPTPEQAYVEISGSDVDWLWASGALFLDARRTEAFEEGHIAGARSFPVWEKDIHDRIASLFDEVTDQEMPIVVYCSGGNCEDSHMLAEKLWGVFFVNVLVYKDGFPDWQARGGAYEVGPEL